MTKYSKLAPLSDRKSEQTAEVALVKVNLRHKDTALPRVKCSYFIKCSSKLLKILQMPKNQIFKKKHFGKPNPL